MLKGFVWIFKRKKLLCFIDQKAFIKKNCGG